MLDSPADFHRLDGRLRLQGKLRTRTALRVGAAQGGAEDVADLPVLRDGRGLPFIPGASLKGVLRSTIESLVRAAENEPRGIWSCDPLDDDVAHRHSRTACGAHERGKRAEADSDRVCAVCRLLGSRTAIDLFRDYSIVGFLVAMALAARTATVIATGGPGTAPAAADTLRA